jgi:hypothetical protein
MDAQNDAAFMPFSRTRKICLERKRFFFEKKEAKTLIPVGTATIGTKCFK